MNMLTAVPPLDLFYDHASKKVALRRVKWYANGFCYAAKFEDSSKIEGIEGNRPLRVGKIRRNPATIALAKFFVYVIAGSNAFERVAVLPIGLVRKALFTIPHFRHIFLNL